MIHKVLLFTRHQLPDYLQGIPCIFGQSHDPTDTEGLYLKAFTYMSELDKNTEIHLYVTGLTAATLAVVRACYTQNKKLVCYHYNRDTNEYFPQRVLG